MGNIEQLSYCTTETNVISALDDKPNATGGLNASQLKAKFDAAATGIKGYVNNTLVPFVNEKVISTLNSLVAAKHTHDNKELLDKYAQDATPTKDSANVVTSDGLYKSIPKVSSGSGIDVAATKLDPDGPTTYMPSINKTTLLNYIYPIGSIYMSSKNVSPAAFLGGAWARVQDCFLLAAGNYYRAGESGGEAYHTLTEAEMPKHRHSFDFYESGTSGSGEGLLGTGFGSNKSIIYSDSAGSGSAHNNMPPYWTVYVWVRNG